VKETANDILEAALEEYEKESLVELWLDYCELKDALHTIGHTPCNAKTMKRIAQDALKRTPSDN
jgi:hypothetical protein